MSAHDAPLFLLPGSHRLGGTIFPHDLVKDGERWLYRDGRGGETICSQLRLTGPTGQAVMWHACTLHGTQPDIVDRARLLLRYLIGRSGKGAAAGIDELNVTLTGPLSMAATRLDLDRRGAASMKA